MTQMDETLKDFLKEVINIGIGDAAVSLNLMTGYHVQMQLPDLLIYDRSNVDAYFESYHNQLLASVNMPFKSEISGTVKLIFNTESAAKLAKILSSDMSFDTDLDMLRISALNELGNIIINAVISTISNQFGIYMEYSIPVYIENTIDHIINANNQSDNFIILLCKTHFMVETINAKGDLVLMFEIPDFDEFKDKIQVYYNKLLAN